MGQIILYASGHAWAGRKHSASQATALADRGPSILGRVLTLHCALNAHQSTHPLPLKSSRLFPWPIQAHIVAPADILYVGQGARRRAAEPTTHSSTCPPSNSNTSKVSGVDVHDRGWLNLVSDSQEFEAIASALTRTLGRTWDIHTLGMASLATTLDVSTVEKLHACSAAEVFNHDHGTGGDISKLLGGSFEWGAPGADAPSQGCTCM